MVKVKIAAVRNAVNRTTDKNKTDQRVEGGWSNVRAQSVASYAWGAMPEDDGKERELWECWWMCKYQGVVRRWYTSTLIQVAVAILIFVNFLVEASAAQAAGAKDPHSSEGIFLVLEWFFTLIFTVELAINMFAHWWWRFWADGWNWFDFIVVAVSLLAVMGGDIPGIAVLRLLRAFRVFRLFKRLESLRKIVKALEESIPGVANAFMILILVMGIYGILGVEFFRNSYVHPVFGVEHNYFGDFGQSMFSLFQVMTGESWSEMIARPCIRKDGTVGSIFFVSYVLVTMYVLVNVVIAVLLEKLMGDVMSTDVDEKYDVFCNGAEWVKRTDPANKKTEEDFIFDAEQDWSFKTDAKGQSVDPKKVERKCVYSHIYKGKFAKVEEGLKGKRIIIRPRPDNDDPIEPEQYDDEGNLVPPEPKVLTAVNKIEMAMSCQVMSVTKMKTDAGKKGYDLIRIEMDKEPTVLDVASRVRWKTGIDPADPTAKFVGRCIGQPKLRPPKKRDGIETYTPPPEPFTDMIKNFKKKTNGYVDLLAWRVQCVNAKLDLLHDNGTCKRVDSWIYAATGNKDFPTAAVYDIKNPWAAETDLDQDPVIPIQDRTNLPYIIEEEPGKADELEEKQQDPDLPDEYAEEQEGGPKTTPDGAGDASIPAVL